MESYQGRNEAFGESEVFLEFQRLLARAAKVDRSVLIIGERGSGKELAAGRLHHLSGRWNAPFVTLNCAALPPGLIESELFGHESGAFTGAAGERKGRFEEAHGGSLFLDEIGLIPIEVQEKILRAVEYGTFQRVGSSRTVEVDVRIIGAANQDLPSLCEQGVFKRDLLDRLSFEVLFIPPLRVRGDDVLMLAEQFAGRMARELGRTEMPFFSEEARRIISGHSWPGNIRELKNTVERAVYRGDGPVVDTLILDPFRNPWEEKGLEAADAAGAAGAAGKNALSSDALSSEGAPLSPLGLDDHSRRGDALSSGGAPLPPEGWPRDIKAAVRRLESAWLKAAMIRAEGRQGKAAELLGLSYDQFRGMYRKFREETDVSYAARTDSR